MKRPVIENRIWLINLFLVGLILTVGVLPLLVSGKSGSIAVSAGHSETVSLGYLDAGTTVEYNWSTDDTGDRVDFSIIDGDDNTYETAMSTYFSSGTFTVLSSNNYYMWWYNNNVLFSADI